MPNLPDKDPQQLTMIALAQSLADWRDALVRISMALRDHQFDLDISRRVAAGQQVDEVLERIKQG